MSLIIGLTGGLATGKTTVAHMFAQLGARVVNADAIVHQLSEPRGVCFREIVKIFGKEILQNGRIDRKRLASVVFTDVRKLRQLEKILHPRVNEIIKKEIRRSRKSKKKEIVILDVPLLFEVGLEKDVDYTVVVKTSQKVQLKRAVQNLRLTREEAHSRIKAQLPLGVKLCLADIIVNNNSRRKETQKQVKHIWQTLKGRDRHDPLSRGTK